MSNETDFSNCSVGDRVWDFIRGWGLITDIRPGHHHPLLVGFNDIYVSYRASGSEYANSVQTLFWDEIKIVPPPRPKRKVTKTVERWANVYKEGCTTSSWLTKAEADYHADDDKRIACVHLTGTYEVEE